MINLFTEANMLALLILLATGAVVGFFVYLVGKLIEYARDMREIRRRNLKVRHMRERIRSYADMAFMEALQGPTKRDD